MLVYKLIADHNRYAAESFDCDTRTLLKERQEPKTAMPVPSTPLNPASGDSGEFGDLLIQKSEFSKKQPISKSEDPYTNYLNKAFEMYNKGL